MVILKTLGGRLQIAVLLPMALSMLALVGCGDSAPSSAVMKVELRNSYTDGSLNTKVYRVTVTDVDGVPMNGLNVNLYGTFTAGRAITLQGVTADAAGGLASIKSSIELNGSGVQDFFLSAPTTATIPIPTPVIIGATELSGTGNLVFGTTYCYGVTALDAQTPQPGQTALSIVSTIVSNITGTSNAIQISWTPVIGASAYNVYGTSGTGCPPAITDLLATVPTSTTVYVDRTNTGGGVTALGFGTSGTAVNTVRGTIDVQSGSLSELLDVSLP